MSYADFFFILKNSNHTPPPHPPCKYSAGCRGSDMCLRSLKKKITVIHLILIDGKYVFFFYIVCNVYSNSDFLRLDIFVSVKFN